MFVRRPNLGKPAGDTVAPDRCLPTSILPRQASTRVTQTASNCRDGAPHSRLSGHGKNAPIVLVVSIVVVSIVVEVVAHNTYRKGVVYTR